MKTQFYDRSICVLLDCSQRFWFPPNKLGIYVRWTTSRACSLENSL